MSESENAPDMPSVATIASSDNSGGAGVQMDLYAFNMLRVHGCSVITCVTAQNSRELRMLEPLNLDMIEAQLDSLVDDFDLKSIKVGMLGTEDIIKFISKYLEKFSKVGGDDFYGPVVDPVLGTTIGGKLENDEKLVDAYRSELLPMTYMLTPNLPEAESLLGREIDIDSEDERLSAMQELHKLGARNVLLKAGHHTSKKGELITDWLLTGEGKLYSFESRYIEGVEVHGTGCMLSALIAAHLALGYKDAFQAVSGAEALLHECLEHTTPKGRGTLRYFNTLECGGWQMQQARVQNALHAARNELINILVPEMVPEVGINFGFALPAARTTGDICALDTRIIKASGNVVCSGGLAFGASSHVARIILAAMQADLRYRSALNLRYSEEAVEACEKLGLSIGSFTREEEPEGAKTMEWGTENAVSKLGYVPDMIFDLGGPGKEPMVRILGRTPLEVVSLVAKLKAEL